MKAELENNVPDESVPPFDLDEDSMEKESLVHDATPEYDVALAEEASREYVGQWNRLISTTNWEKGRLIFQWRESMRLSGVPLQLYSDEAWSRRVGNVSSQHVGRLRRVFERFSEVYTSFAGLYWSHFQAAIDWEDAELWLEGASQQRWSVAGMRKQRWLAIGAPPECQPNDEVLLGELDEDVVVGFDSGGLSGASGTADLPDPASNVTYGLHDLPEAPGKFGNGDGDADAESEEGRSRRGNRAESEGDADKLPPSLDPDRPEAEDVSKTEDEMRTSVVPGKLFENMPELPADMSDAFEMFKLAILNHKLANWGQVPKDDVLLALAILRQLCES